LPQKNQQYLKMVGISRQKEMLLYFKKMFSLTLDIGK